MITTIITFHLLFQGQPVASYTLPTMEICHEFKEGVLAEVEAQGKQPGKDYEFVCVENSKYEEQNQ